MSSSQSGGLHELVTKATGWKLSRARKENNAPWKLSSPFWIDEVELKTQDLFSPKRIRIAAVEQKGVFIPETFDRDWLEGRTGVDEKKGRLIREPSLLELLLTRSTEPAE